MAQARIDTTTAGLGKGGNAGGARNGWGWGVRLVPVAGTPGSFGDGRDRSLPVGV